MSTLAVVGAGPIGAAVAHQAAAARLVRQVVLVDDAAEVARGLALDIQQAGALAGTATRVNGSDGLEAVVGARVVVLADRHGPDGEWRGEPGLAVLTRIRAFNPRAVVVCAGALQADLVEAVIRERDADRRRLVASAPEALRSAMTALTCLETGAAPGDVSLIAIGRPPHEMFVPWEGAAIGGTRAAQVLPAAVVARLDRQLPHLWPPGPLTLAAAAVRVGRLVIDRAPGWASVFLVPPADGGPRLRGVALPARVADGTLAPIWPDLVPRDRVRLETALAG